MCIRDSPDVFSIGENKYEEEKICVYCAVYVPSIRIIKSGCQQTPKEGDLLPQNANYSKINIFWRRNERNQWLHLWKVCIENMESVRPGTLQDTTGVNNELETDTPALTR